MKAKYEAMTDCLILMLLSLQSGNKLTDPEPFNLMLPGCNDTAACEGRRKAFM
jgi:hypothetical protein